MPKGAYDQLEDIQRTFYRYLFATPISTPSPALLWETGGLTMRNRVNLRKMMFFHHLMSLEEDAVASRVARVADRSGYPGLMQEYKSLCAELNLPSPVKTSKLTWKRLVKKAITDANKSELLRQIEHKYAKLDFDTLKEETFELKGYVKSLNMYDGRMKFQIRSKMVKNIAFNYSSDPATVINIYGGAHKHSWFC